MLLLYGPICWGITPSCTIGVAAPEYFISVPEPRLLTQVVFLTKHGITVVV